MAKTKQAIALHSEIIKKFIGEQKSVDEIQQELGITNVYLRGILNEYRRKTNSPRLCDLKRLPLDEVLGRVTC